MCFLKIVFIEVLQSDLFRFIFLIKIGVQVRKNGGGGGGGARRKSDKFLLRERMMLYYHTGRFVNVLLFFEMFNSQNSNFHGTKSLKQVYF